MIFPNLYFCFGSLLIIWFCVEYFTTYRNLPKDMSYGTEEAFRGYGELKMNWKSTLVEKVKCWKREEFGIFFYHFRKAAGTTFKLYLGACLKNVYSNKLASYFMQEGLTLNERMLHTGLLTMTVLRNPIDRIISLYWYEHADFWIREKQNLTALKPFEDWARAW